MASGHPAGDDIARWQAGASIEFASDDDGIVKRLLRACVDSLAHLLLFIQDDFARKHLRRSHAILKLWSMGHGAWDGRLDSLLERSKDLQQITLSILNPLCKILNSGLHKYAELDNSTAIQLKVQNSQIHSQTRWLLKETDGDVSDSDSDGYSSRDSNNSNLGNKRGGLNRLVEDVKMHVQCLSDLSNALEAPAIDPEPTDDPSMLKIEQRAAHDYHVDLITAKFPKAQTNLAECLGKISWDRYQRMQQEREINASKLTGPALEDESARKSHIADSEFMDSGLGTSLPAPPTRYAETVISFMTSIGGGKRVQIPPLPPDAKSGSQFECNACGRHIRAISNREWRKHLYLDLQPYTCLFAGCAFSAQPFADRQLWSNHLELDHQLGPGWKSVTCPLCLEVTDPGKSKILIHFARHMEDIALAALPREVDDEIEYESDNSFLKSAGSFARSSEGKDIVQEPESSISNVDHADGERAKTQGNETGDDDLVSAREELRHGQPETPRQSLRETALKMGQKGVSIRDLWERGATQAQSASINQTHPLMINIDFDMCHCKIYELRQNGWHDLGTGFVKIVGPGSAQWDIVVWSEGDADSQRLLWSPISRDDGFQRQQDTLIVWTTQSGTNMAMSFQHSEGCSMIWQVIKEASGLVERNPAEPIKHRGDLELQRKASDRLQAWFATHTKDPYPSASQISMLARECVITETEVETALTDLRSAAKVNRHYGSMLSNSSPTLTRTGRVSKAKKGLKVHNCECGKSYTRLEHLKRHQKNHESDNQYKCDVCAKVFYRYDLFERHKERHEEEDKHMFSMDGYRASDKFAAPDAPSDSLKWAPSIGTKAPTVEDPILVNTSDQGSDYNQSGRNPELSSESETEEPRYCYCNEVSYGNMVACDNDDCPREWFHLACVNLEHAPVGRKKWFCSDECKEVCALPKKRFIPRMGAGEVEGPGVEVNRLRQVNKEKGSKPRQLEHAIRDALPSPANLVAFADERNKERAEASKIGRSRYTGMDSSTHTRRPTKLPAQALHRLQTWLRDHRDNPYPGAETKQIIAQECGITEKQVNTWFTNARARKVSYRSPEDEGDSDTSGSSMANTPMLTSAAVHNSRPSRELASLGYAGRLSPLIADGSWNPDHIYDGKTIDQEPRAEKIGDRLVQRRRRPALSCVECRSRKIKCDREKPCGACVQVKSTTCTYRPEQTGFRSRSPRAATASVSGSNDQDLRHSNIQNDNHIPTSTWRSMKDKTEQDKASTSIMSRSTGRLSLLPPVAPGITEDIETRTNNEHGEADQYIQLKRVTFELRPSNSKPTRARLPMRVDLGPYDTTDSIITTVKNYYGLYDRSGVTFEDSHGSPITIQYEKIEHNMVCYVRVSAEDVEPRETHPGSHQPSASPPHSPQANVDDASEVLPANSEPVEFDTALSFVNKIKNRYASQPEIYKQFLEILQTYQREIKPIQDVYAELTTLFSTAPDLVEEFKMFFLNSAAQVNDPQEGISEYKTSDQQLPTVSSIAPNWTSGNHAQTASDRDYTDAMLPQPRLGAIPGADFTRKVEHSGSMVNTGSNSGYQHIDRPHLPPVSPADQNPPCNTLYVGNLSMNTSEEELKAIFAKQRGYKRLCYRTKQNGPMCFVEFEDTTFATQALNDLNGHLLQDRVKGGIRLSFSKNPLGVRSGQSSASGPPSKGQWTTGPSRERPTQGDWVLLRDMAPEHPNIAPA